MEIKYDVFISYSRRDYVDENKNIIEGNVISVIKKFLEDHGISYWIDEEGDLTGKKFANIIAKAIRESLIFLFVCTENSVASKWVDRELSTADTFDKHIIPFICDESYKNDNVVLYTSALDRIEYHINPKKEVAKLLTSIKNDKKKHEENKQKEIELQQKSQKEAENLKKKQEEEARKEKTREEIQIHAEECQKLIVQQETIVKQLINKNISVGHRSKVCPICNTTFSLNQQYCKKCGWQFPLLYSLDGNSNYAILDETQLSIARTNWQNLRKVFELRTINKNLKNANLQLEKENQILASSNENMSIHLKEQVKYITMKESEVASLYDEIKKHQAIVANLEKRISSLTSDLSHNQGYMMVELK